VPPQVIDDTNPVSVDRTGNSATPAGGQLASGCGQLGSRVPAIVVSGMARLKVAHEGPLGHGCTLEMIESAFGRLPLAAWDASAVDLRHGLRHRVPQEASRASSQVPGPPATPPRSAAPPASSRFLRARRPRGKRDAAMRVLPQSGYRPEAGWRD
jgi:hypothetical protein